VSVFWRPAALFDVIEPLRKEAALSKRGNKNAEVWRLWSRGKGTAKDHGKRHLFSLRSQTHHQKVGSKRCNIFTFFREDVGLTIKSTRKRLKLIVKSTYKMFYTEYAVNSDYSVI